MRIVQLANFYGPTSGGLRTAVDTLGRGYLAAGHERVLVVPGEHTETRHTDAGLLVTVRGMPVSGGYRMIWRQSSVRRVLDDLSPQSVEVSDKATLLAAAGWARDRGVAAVLFSHERLDRWIAARLPALWRFGGALPAKAVRHWNRGIARRFATVVVTSSYAEREFAGLGVHSLRRIPLGVDLTTFRPGAPHSAGGPIRLVYAGRLSPEKNPHAVIDAVGVLAARGLPVRLDVYGDGPAQADLRRRADTLPVDFHGHLTDRGLLAGRLAAADVAFAPSVAETFGLSALEAMACATPVVTAAGGGAAELLAPKAGVAVPGTPHDLADGVSTVLSWPAGERRTAARRRAEQFPWSSTIASMLDLHAQPVDVSDQEPR